MQHNHSSRKQSPECFAKIPRIGKSNGNMHNTNIRTMYFKEYWTSEAPNSNVSSAISLLGAEKRGSTKLRPISACPLPKTRAEASLRKTSCPHIQFRLFRGSLMNSVTHGRNIVRKTNPPPPFFQPFPPRTHDISASFRSHHPRNQSQTLSPTFSDACTNTWMSRWSQVGSANKRDTVKHTTCATAEKLNHET